MHERLPGLLGVDVPVVPRLIDRVSTAVVLHDVGVIDEMSAARWSKSSIG